MNAEKPLRTTGILIASSRNLFSDGIGAHLRNMGIDVFSASTGEECIKLLYHDISAVMVDAESPGMHDFLALPREQHPNVTVALVSDEPPEPGMIGPNITSVQSTQNLTQLLSLFSIRPKPAPTVTDDTVVVAVSRGALERLPAVLEAEGLTVLCAAEAREVEELFSRARIRVVVLDLLLPGGGGLDLLRSWKERFPMTEIIVMGPSDKQIARLAVEMGAFDYVHEFLDQQAAYSIIQTALSHSHFQEENMPGHHLWPFASREKDLPTSKIKTDVIARRRQLVRKLNDLRAAASNANPQLAAALESCVSRAGSGDFHCPVGQLCLSDYLLTGYLAQIGNPICPPDPVLSTRLETKDP